MAVPTGLLMPISCIGQTNPDRGFRKTPEAIKGFTELGSGFKIAMQDLSIRGAEIYLELPRVASSIPSAMNSTPNSLRQPFWKTRQDQKRQKSNTEMNLY